MGAAGKSGGRQDGVAAAAARLGRRAAAVAAGPQHELNFAAIRGAGVLWVTLEALTAEPSRSAVLAAMESRGRHGHTILDLACAPELWAPELQAEPGQCRRWAREGLDWASLAAGDLAACAAATGAASPVPIDPVPIDPVAVDPVAVDPVAVDPVAVGWALLGHGVRTAVIRHGAGEVLGMDTACQVRAGPEPVGTAQGGMAQGGMAQGGMAQGGTAQGGTAQGGTADPYGADAAFGAALCHGLLEGWELARVTRFAAASATPG
jgi:5-dehydro-2-deoxygluconokinase